MEIHQTYYSADIEREIVGTPSRIYSGSNSINGDPSHGSPRGRKRSPEAQYNYEELKRERLDHASFSANDNDATLESSDSLFNSQGSCISSQRSLTDEISISQTASSAIGMSGYYYPSIFENVDIQPSQPGTTGSYAGETNHGIQASESPTKHSNEVARGKRSRLLSSQESVNDEAEFSERDLQKAKNRRYAKDSRERKNKRINSLELTTTNQKFIIQIYKKVIGVYWKRLNGAAVPRWATYTIPWYSSTDGECGQRHEVQCLLPVEDNSFFEELGNDPFGQIIAKNSIVQYQEDLPLSTNNTIRNSVVVKISNSGSISKDKSVSKPTSDVLKVYQNINDPSFSHHRNSYIQNPSVKSDFTDTSDDVQTRSENLSFPTPSGTLKDDDLYETDCQSGLDDQHTPASQTPVISHETTITMPHRQVNSGLNDTSSATVSAEYSRTTHPINTVGTFNGQTVLLSNDSFRTTQATCRLVLDVAGSVPNSQPNDSGISELFHSQSCSGSGGNVFNTDKPEGRGFVNKPENKLFFSHARENFLVNEEPVNLSSGSSMENVYQETPGVEDLHSTLQIA